MTALSTESCISRYIQCMFSALSELQMGVRFNPKDLDNSDLQAIEHILKDVSKRPASANLSQSGCAEIFAERIEKLSKGDQEEWDRLAEFIQTHTDTPDKNILTAFAKYYRHFKPKVKAKKVVPPRTRLE